MYRKGGFLYKRMNINISLNIYSQFPNKYLQIANLKAMPGRRSSHLAQRGKEDASPRGRKEEGRASDAKSMNQVSMEGWEGFLEEADGCGFKPHDEIMAQFGRERP